MYNQIICCVACHRSIGHILSAEKILEHRKMYNCMINQWLSLNNLQYLEYKLGQKEKEIA
jgi:hypothetical protein